jgi:hypothetical protein
MLSGDTHAVDVLHAMACGAPGRLRRTLSDALDAVVA